MKATMSSIGIVFLLGALFGGFVGAAVQRTRFTFLAWRKAVASIPVLRGVFYVEARHAAALLSIAAAIAIGVFAA
jgi:hypothetical protein